MEEKKEEEKDKDYYFCFPRKELSMGQIYGSKEWILTTTEDAWIIERRIWGKRFFIDKKTHDFFLVDMTPTGKYVYTE